MIRLVDTATGYWTQQRPGPLGLNGLGATQLGAIGCKELNAVVDVLGAALREAERSGVPEWQPSYVAAQSFYDRETGTFSSTWFVGSESCKNLVDQGNALIAGLNKEIMTAQGITVPPVNANLAPPEDLAGTIKSVAIAAAIIATAFMVVPVIGPVVAAIKMKGKGK